MNGSMVEQGVQDTLDLIAYFCEHQAYNRMNSFEQTDALIGALLAANIPATQVYAQWITQKGTIGRLTPFAIEIGGLTFGGNGEQGWEEITNPLVDKEISINDANEKFQLLLHTVLVCDSLEAFEKRNSDRRLDIQQRASEGTAWLNARRLQQSTPDAIERISVVARL